MFGWIAKSALPDDDTIRWVFDVYEWLLSHTGGYEDLDDTPLVLPSDAFFPPPPVDIDDDERFAAYLFELTKKHAKMAEWPCTLTTHENAPSTTDILGHVPHAGGGLGGACGTFRFDGNGRAIITYSPDQLADTSSFVATMAHELSHYLMSSIPVNPPDGIDDEEPATDVCTVFMGYGIFVANSAVSFQQFQDARLQGWSMQSRGYLSQRTLAYALAIFLELRGMSNREVKRYLSPNPRAYLKHARRHVLKYHAERLAALRRIEDVDDSATEQSTA